MKILLLFLGIFTIIISNNWFVTSALIDENENCEFWASTGECEANPGYMLTSCSKSCSEVGKTQDFTSTSFYDIIEKDIHGNEISFDQFRGKVVYIVNVASQCGYTKSNYALIRKLKQYIDQGLEIVISPCNQFGNQEPGDSSSIATFAQRQNYEGTILAKGDVNGRATRPLFAYLKGVTGKNHISWNFDGKFLVDRSGNVYRVDSEVDVEPKILELLQSSEL